MHFIYTALALLAALAYPAHAHSRLPEDPAPSLEDSAPQARPARLPRAHGALLGLRFGQGDAFDGKLSSGLSFEYLYSNNFGFNAQAYYASYGTELTAGPAKLQVKNRAITVAALGNYHPSFIHVPMLDPFLSVGLAHSFVKTTASAASAEQPELALPPITASGDSTFLVGSLNARYFLDRNLSVLGSLGLGLSTLTLGIDYLF